MVESFYFVCVVFESCLKINNTLYHIIIPVSSETIEKCLSLHLSCSNFERK